ncbi:hydrogenase maturation nickel metallochaperone HypA [bacterium]|nr:hydrogenase maturation nickel metallochaperone HypA [bacterium]
MHEYSIAKGIVKVVMSTIAGREEKVKKIWIKSGIAKAIMPDALFFSFDVLKKQHNQLADTELCLDIVPISGHCNECGQDFEISKIIAICPNCGSSDVEWTGGNELFIEKIEII